MEVHSLLRSRIQTAEEDLALEKARQRKAQQMNIYIKALLEMFGNPVFIWLMATITVFLCIVVALGIHWACGLLALWVTISTIGYFIHVYRS